VKAVKDNISIPVIGNGDIISAKLAEKFLNYTNCDGIMIGRAARGNPWIFTKIKHYLQTGEELAPPTIDEKFEIIRRHAELLCKFNGEINGMKKFRKHLIWYCRGLKLNSETKVQMVSIKNLTDLEIILSKVLAAQTY
jgi:tRNA-dihydrouridine synthase